MVILRKMKYLSCDLCYNKIIFYNYKNEGFYMKKYSKGNCFDVTNADSILFKDETKFNQSHIADVKTLVAL